MKTLRYMMKTILHKMKAIHCKMKTLQHKIMTINMLKYKVNEATFLPLHIKTEITATEALDGKIFFTLGESKKNSKL